MSSSGGINVVVVHTVINHGVASSTSLVEVNGTTRTTERVVVGVIDDGSWDLCVSFKFHDTACTSKLSERKPVKLRKIKKIKKLN